MGVPESVFSLGPWDESGNPFTMSTVRRNHEHSAPLSPRHAGPQRRTAAERADRAFTFHRGRSEPAWTHRPRALRDTPRRARPDLIAAYGSPFAADPRRSVRLRMYFKVHPRRWMAARSTGRSTTKQPAVGERAWGTGLRPFPLRVERRDSRYHTGEGAGPGAVLGLAPTSH